MVAYAVLHFEIVRQKGPVQVWGLAQSCVIVNLQGFIHAQVYCPQEDLIAGAFQLLPDSKSSLSQ